MVSVRLFHRCSDRDLEEPFALGFHQSARHGFLQLLNWSHHRHPKPKDSICSRLISISRMKPLRRTSLRGRGQRFLRLTSLSSAQVPSIYRNPPTPLPFHPSFYRQSDKRPNFIRGTINALPVNDGVDKLVKYSSGIAPLASAETRLPSQILEGNGSATGFPVVCCIRDTRVSGDSIQVRVGYDLSSSTDLGSTVVATEDLGDGTERVCVRSNASFASQNKQFFRLEVTED